MTDEYENFIQSEENKSNLIKQLSDFRTLHDLKKEISSHVDWFNNRSKDQASVFHMNLMQINQD
jgi:hypothetical protein